MSLGEQGQRRKAEDVRRTGLSLVDATHTERYVALAPTWQSRSPTDTVTRLPCPKFNCVECYGEAAKRREMSGKEAV